MIINAYLYSLKKGKSLSLINLKMYIRSLVKVTFFCKRITTGPTVHTKYIKEAFFCSQVQKRLGPHAQRTSKLRHIKIAKIKTKWRSWIKWNLKDLKYKKKKEFKKFDEDDANYGFFSKEDAMLAW